MKNHLLCTSILVATALAGFAAMANDDSEQSEFPTIIAQPTDQGVWAGEPAVFTVQATNGAAHFQWKRNGKVIAGATNSVLYLEEVGYDDVGLYSCDVAKEDGEAVPTRSASLNMMMSGGEGLVIYGAPVSSSGSSGTCPGSYIGYVTYTKTIANGWGWAPSSGTTVHTATDWNRSDTKVVYMGRNGDVGCAPTTVTVPSPTTSQKYRFTIYFANNVPTNSYAITLDGFDP